MRLVFSDYSEDFNEVAKKYDEVNDTLHRLEEEDLLDDDATTEKYKIKE